MALDRNVWGATISRQAEHVFTGFTLEYGRAANRIDLGTVDTEHSLEPRHVQQLSHGLGGLNEGQISAMTAKNGTREDELAKASSVYGRHASQIESDIHPSLGNQRPDG